MDFRAGGVEGLLRVVTLCGFVSASVSHDFIESPAFIVFVYAGTLSASARSRSALLHYQLTFCVSSTPFEKKGKQFFFQTGEKKNLNDTEKHRLVQMLKDIDMLSEDCFGCRASTSSASPPLPPPAAWA